MFQTIQENKGKEKVKSPYFTLVAQNSHLTDKPEADGTPPTFLSISAPFYKYLRLLKATWKGKKLKDGIEVTTGNQT